MDQCANERCERPSKTRGYCASHYRMARMNGTLPLLPPKTWVDRYWEKVRKTDSCWLWTGAIADTGYGTHGIDGKTKLAHRIAVELDGRSIPKGMVVDHLCRVRNCVRPDHLEVVTFRVNIARGTSPSSVARQTETCHRGHSLADAIVVLRSNGKVTRRCRTCRNDRRRAQNAAKRAAAADCGPERCAFVGAE